MKRSIKRHQPGKKTRNFYRCQAVARHWFACVFWYLHESLTMRLAISASMWISSQPVTLVNVNKSTMPCEGLNNYLNVILFMVTVCKLFHRGLPTQRIKAVLSLTLPFATTLRRKIMTHTFTGLSIFRGLFRDPSRPVHFVNCRAASNLGNWRWLSLLRVAMLIYGACWQSISDKYGRKRSKGS